MEIGGRTAQEPASAASSTLIITTTKCRLPEGMRNYITRLFDKIGVEHRYQAIVLARDAGLGRGSGLGKLI